MQTGQVKCKFFEFEDGCLLSDSAMRPTHQASIVKRTAMKKSILIRVCHERDTYSSFFVSCQTTFPCMYKDILPPVFWFFQALLYLMPRRLQRP